MDHSFEGIYGQSKEFRLSGWKIGTGCTSLPVDADGIEGRLLGITTGWGSDGTRSDESALLAVLAVALAFTAAVTVAYAARNNDDLGRAQKLNLKKAPLSVSSDTANATHEEWETRPLLTCFDVWRTVWYRFDVKGTAPYRIDTDGSTFDTVLVLYRSDVRRPDENGLGLPFDCDDDGGPGLLSVIETELEPGSYYLMGAEFKNFVDPTEPPAVPHTLTVNVSRVE